MNTSALFRSGSLRVIVSPVLTLMFIMAAGLLYGAFQWPELSQITNLNAFWTVCAGFALIEVIWPCEKSGVEANPSMPARIAFAAIVALGLAGIGYGTLSIIALAL